MTYEYFRDKIKAVLESADGGITWTDLRGRAGLPQLFPNNQWVRRLEKDIALSRDRDAHGMIRWQLRGKG